MWWSTHYYLPTQEHPKPYYSAIWTEGDDVADVLHVIKRRNIPNEHLFKYLNVVFVPIPPSVMMRDQAELQVTDSAIFHGLCFLGFLATCSGAATAFDLFNDEGVIHQAAHYYHFGKPRNNKQTPTPMFLDPVVEQVAKLEQKVPGMIGPVDSSFLAPYSTTYHIPIKNHDCYPEPPLLKGTALDTNEEVG